MKSRLSKCEQCEIDFRSSPSSCRKFCGKNCYIQSLVGKPPTNLSALHSKEARLKQSVSMTGRISPLKGRKMSQETRKKMSMSALGKRTKESNPMWKGGITPINKAIRTFNKYIEWRRLVFKRDDFRCQRCPLKGVYLEAHHIIPLSELINKFSITSLDEADQCEELWDIKNGITLCQRCHGVEDRYRGYLLKIKNNNIQIYG